MYLFQKLFHLVINSRTAIFDHLALIPTAKVKVNLNHFDVQFRKNLLCTAFFFKYQVHYKHLANMFELARYSDTHLNYFRKKKSEYLPPRTNWIELRAQTT